MSNKKKTFNQKYLSAMSYLMNPSENEKPRTRKKRCQETAPRDMAEKRLENDIFIKLIQTNLTVNNILAFGKVECSSTYNSKYDFHGFAEVVIFNLETRILWFIELKVGNRPLRPKQILFQKYCHTVGGNVRHRVIRSLLGFDILLSEIINQGEDL